MMRGGSTLLWRMIRLLGQNAGLLSNALEVGKRLSLMIDGQRLLASIPMSLLGSIASFRPWFGHFRSATAGQKQTSRRKEATSVFDPKAK
jgi:hypothetical protein